MTNLKIKYNQNCQKSELYGSLITKELKKKHSFRLVGAAEMGSPGAEDSWQGSGWRSYICMQINQEEQLGSETDHTTQGPSAGI